MLKELYTAAMGMMPQQTRLEVIANNMANASTIGFKRDSVFERNLIDAKSNLFNVPGSAEDDDMPIGTYIDYRTGAMQQTFNPLDMAIQNGGFFVTQDEEGKQFLTRDGHFKLSEDGSITAMDGKLLIGENGPINVQSQVLVNKEANENLNTADIKITQNGEVFVNSQSVGRVTVAQVDGIESLQKISGADFVATDPSRVKYIPENDVEIKQGWLESSNVDIIKEMVSMIELQRGFEAGSKVITTNDTTLDNSIRLGRYA